MIAPRSSIGGPRSRGHPLRRLGALLFATSLLTATASAGDGLAAWEPVYDVTHFDVLPVTSPYDSEQIAYPALFAHRDASTSDPGSESFRIINWLVAPNHSFIVDVWKNLADFEAHLAQPHSVAFRFAVQDLPPPDSGCCIDSPIDDRQYSLVGSFGTPWISTGLPTTVGPEPAPSSS
jgi:quinol monooxygenase YgiN